MYCALYTAFSMAKSIIGPRPPNDRFWLKFWGNKIMFLPALDLSSAGISFWTTAGYIDAGNKSVRR
jgi:hypothetical protein